MSTTTTPPTRVAYGTPSYAEGFANRNSINERALMDSQRGGSVTFFGARGEQSTATTLSGWVFPELPQNVEANLNRIRALPVGWDGAGIAAVAETTISRTRFFLGLAFFHGEGELPNPFMSPAHDGRLILEWETDSGKELIVDIPPSLSTPIRFLLVEPHLSGEETEIESEISDIWSIQAIIRALVGNQPTANISVPDAMDGSNQMSSF